jgi:hypothetical protein
MLRNWIERALASVSGQPPEPPAESRIVEGVRVDVINTRPDIDTERVFRRAEAVLQRVHEYQPWRLAHMRRDLAGILVKRYPCRGAYINGARVCLLELTFMANEDFSDSQVAACLIHEGMHARLDRLAAKYGITSFEHARARHERICRRAELDFGLAVPDGQPVVQRAMESLQMADDEVAPTIEWAEASRRVAAVDEDAAGRKPRG